MGQSVDVTQLLCEIEYYLGKVLVQEELSLSCELLRKDFVAQLECLGLPDALSDLNDTNDPEMLIFPSDDKETKANSSSSSNLNHTLSGDSKHVFACTHCDVKFSCIKSLIQHQRQHYSRKKTKSASTSLVKTSKPHTCGDSSEESGSWREMSSRLGPQHVEPEGSTRGAGGQVWCRDCGLYFADRGSYNKHVKLMHSAAPAPLRCSFCEATFGAPSQLKRHELSHQEEKKYLCGVCGSRFLTASHLAQHQKIHSDVKPYVCPQCNASFVRLFQLQRHMRRHTGERPYVCSYCGTAFSHASRLKYHTMRHTGEKPFCCQSCGTAFRESHHLKAHMRTHTSSRAYPCMLCDAAFASETAQRRHVASHTSPLSQHTASLSQHTANPGHTPGHAHPDTLTLTLWNTVDIG